MKPTAGNQQHATVRQHEYAIVRQHETGTNISGFSKVLRHVSI